MKAPMKHTVWLCSIHLS